MRPLQRGFHPTSWRFAHWRTGEDGARELVWASGGVGELPGLREGSPLAVEALLDRLWTPNAWADEGEEDMLDTYFRNGTAPTFFFSLWNDTPVDTDTLATLLGEVTGTGYARISVARNTTDWPTHALQGGDWRTDSVTKTFTAGGAWTAATQLVLASVSSGTSGLHLGWAALSATRTLASGDSLDTSMRVSLA